MAIAGATGISSGSAHTIAQLLLKEFNKDNILSYSSIEFADRKSIDGKIYQTIIGIKSNSNLKTTLFIDIHEKTIYQVVTRLSEFTSIETRRNIRLNSPLSKAIFLKPNT